MKTATTFGANALRWSVSLALGVGMTSTAGVAFAQDADADDESISGRVEVTGSRIKRADIEGALPVTVIDRNQIELSGQTSVADLLRNTTFNSFGSFRPASGSSAQSFAGLSLRGLGSSRTLILIDGRRAPTAPNVGSAQDLNSIPLAAVERVEILSDGASAIYGTDAIGGVVNIITRKDFTGVQMTYGMGKPKQLGGDTEEGSILFGASSDRGQVMGGASFNNREIVFQRHREWSTGGQSTFGNNLFTASPFGFVADPTFGSGYPGACHMPGFFLVSTGASQRCAFDFTSTAADEAEINNQAVFIRGNYRINDIWSTYFGAGVTRVKSFGRYAPVPDFAFIPADSTNHPYGNPASPYYDPTHPTFGEDLYVAHRFAALGNRDSFIDSNVYDVNFGFQGTVGMFDLDVGMRRNEFKYIDLGRNYLVRSTAAAYIASGRYNLADPFGNDPQTLNAMKATISRESQTRIEELYAVANTDLPFEMSGGVVGLAFGAEYREETYSDLYDSLSEAGQIGGSAGNSAGLDRDVTAMFFEVLLPVMPDLEVSIAGRHDDYSDYGSDFSPKISARWQPMDNLTLRASYGEGFAAPTLDLLSMSPSFSADFTTDPQTCIALGLTVDANGVCRNANNQAQSPQVDMFVIANPNLGSEQSKQFSIGGAWDAAEWVNLSMDYYNIQIDNRISSISLSTIINCLAGQIACPPGVSALDPSIYTPAFTGDPSLGLGIARDPNNGRIVFGQRGFVNRGDLETDGIDLNVRTNFAFGGWGTLQNQLQIGHVLGYSFDGGNNLVGRSGVPETRASLGNVWSYGDFQFVWNIDHIASTDNSGGNGTTHSWTTHDVQFIYHAPWNGRLTVGVDNLGDKDPPLDGGLSRGFDTSLYDPYGRVPYIRYTQTF